jgi:hypothetical protein
MHGIGIPMQGLREAGGWARGEAYLRLARTML